MRTAARSSKGYVTKPQLRRKQRLHAQRAVGERVQADDVTQPADHAQHVKVPFVDMVIVVLVVLQREVPTIQKVQRFIEVFQKTSSGQDC